MNDGTPRNKALITGASSGIGAAYADRLAHRGYDLVLVARNRERLDAHAKALRQASGARIETLVADLTTQADLAQIEARLRADADLSMLVNNAGVAAPSELIDADLDRLVAVIQLNVIAVMRLAAVAATEFVARGRGSIVNIASVLALAPERFSGVYSGTKAFVLNLSQSLHREVSGKGVRVQAVLPGATITEMWDRSGIGIENIPAAMLMPAGDLVDAALLGLDAGELVTLPSLPDVGQWRTFEEARLAMGPNLSRSRPAERYLAARP